MKFRWVPAVVLVSILFGVILGVRIHDLNGIFLQKEKAAETSQVDTPEQTAENVGKTNANGQSKTENQSASNQEQAETESKEAFSDTSKPVDPVVGPKGGFLSKVGKNIDKGVTSVFANLIARVN